MPLYPHHILQTVVLYCTIANFQYLISNMCTRVVINKSIQYKINEFALCSGSRKQHRIVKMVSRYF